MKGLHTVRGTEIKSYIAGRCCGVCGSEVALLLDPLRPQREKGEG